MMKKTILALILNIICCSLSLANYAHNNQIGVVDIGNAGFSIAMQQAESSHMFAVPEFFSSQTAISSEQKIILAHAILVKSDPEKEEVKSTAPTKVELWFDDSVGPKYTALAVVNSKGKRVDNKDGALDFTDRSHLTATVKKLTPGRYGVRYRVQSADGHIVTGKYFFSIAE